MPKCQNSSYKSVRYGSCNNTANNTIFVGKVSRLFGNIPDGLETFQTVRKLSTLSVNFPHCQENFQNIWKLSGPSGNFSDHLETFQTIWKLSRPSGNLPGLTLPNNTRGKKPPLMRPNLWVAKQHFKTFISSYCDTVTLLKVTADDLRI